MKTLNIKKLKNAALVSALLVFGLGILGASIWRTSAKSISENYKLGPVGEQEITEPIQKQATETAKKEVNYFLAYPGILPDHFIYPLKMVRDKIWLFLTTDPLKKAELYLLFADKRIGAAKALIEGNKVDLGITTLTKAEKYLEKAVNQEKIAKQAGKGTNAFLKKLSQSSLKHEEIILEFKEKIPGAVESTYENALQISRQVYQRVKQTIGE